MLNQIEDAAYLVSCGLKPKLNTHNHTRYRECVDTYQTDDEYRERVNQIAAGFGLRVLDVSQFGIVMAIVDKKSPFRPILSNIKTQFAEVDQRLMFGATLLSIAAICFPNESSFDYDSARYVTVTDVRQRLIQLAESFNDKPDEQQEVVAGLTDAWEVIKEKATISRQPSGRHTRGSLAWVVEQTFNYLAEQKFISLKTDEEEETYRTHSKFRIYVREFAAIRAFEVIREALVKTEDTI